MKAMMLTLLLALAATSAPAAEVWKCKIGERIVFSDSPCPNTGKPLEQRELQGNVVDSIKLPAKDEEPAAGRPGSAENNSCPDELELRNMQTRSNSIALGAAEKAFILDEVRRARQCRKGQGRYSAEDWRLSREAQNAQSGSAAAAARQRAEDMHSAADPIEGDRIARQRLQEEADRQAAQRVRRPVGP